MTNLLFLELRESAYPWRLILSMASYGNACYAGLSLCFFSNNFVNKLSEISSDSPLSPNSSTFWGRSSQVISILNRFGEISSDLSLLTKFHRLTNFVKSVDIVNKILSNLLYSLLHAFLGISRKNCRDNCDVSCFKILDHAKSYSKLKVKESFINERLKRELNKQVEHVGLLLHF